MALPAHAAEDVAVATPELGTQIPTAPPIRADKVQD